METTKEQKMENSELQKHLVAVIDEAIAEIEDLKKSKFDAQEIKMEGAGEDGIAGQKANGSIGKADEDDDEKEEKDEMDKADGVNNQADSDAGSFKQSSTVGKGEDCMDKGEDCMDKADDDDEDDDEKKKKDMEKADGKNNEADPDKGAFKASESVKKSADEEDEEDSLRKSFEEQEELMKSYVDEKFAALEKTIAAVLESVEAIADSPAPAKGVTADGFTALKKNDDEEIQPLNKSYVADKLFGLKKSGENIDSADIIKVETGSQNDIAAVAQKYGLVKR